MMPALDLWPRPGTTSAHSSTEPGRAIHLQSTYYLPSWQGGDVVIPRCRRTEAGYTSYGAEPPLMTAIAAFVSCPSCRHFVLFGRRQSSVRRGNR